jgi:CysZ protein
LRPSLTIFSNLTEYIVLTSDKYLATLPDQFSFLFYLITFITSCIKVILVIALFIIIGFLITQFGSILGSPWYGKLSEQIEIIKQGKLAIIEINIFHDIWRAILFEFKKIVLIIIVGLPLLLFNFIPTFGSLVSAFGGIFLTATIVCLDFIDAPLERRRLTFRNKLQFVKKALPTTAGFGLICLILVSIPLLNLIVVPLCVSAGTLLVCDRLSEN